MRYLFGCAFFLLSCSSDDSNIPSPGTNASTPQIPFSIEAKYLQDNTIAVDINAQNDDYSSLEPLKEKIGRSRIVLLGEQTHGDGTTFLAKTRLIQFLHEEMDFDVLVFESGLYDCWKAEQLLKTGVSARYAIEGSLYPVWSKSGQLSRLIEYIGYTQTTSDRLELAGMDVQFSGPFSSYFFIADLEELIQQHDATLLAQPAWLNAKLTLERVLAERSGWQPTAVEQTLFFEHWEHINNNLIPLLAPQDATQQQWMQILTMLPDIVRLLWNIDNYVLRDRRMGENLIWLARTRYPDKKLIIWAASSHNARNYHTLTFPDGSPPPYPDWVSMGHIAWLELKAEIYNIAFTAYEGHYYSVSSSNTRNIPRPTKGSLEYLWGTTQVQNGILDLTQLNEQGAWLQSPLLAKPFAYGEMSGNWSSVVDAFFYTRTMVPNEINL